MDLLWPARRPDDYDPWHPPRWTEQALCAEVDPDLFFPEKSERAEPARRICARCEVRAQCLDYALEHGIRWGVWGGVSERERRKLRRQVAA